MDVKVQTVNHYFVLMLLLFVTSCSDVEMSKMDESCASACFKNVVGKLKKCDVAGNWEFLQIPELGNAVEAGKEATMSYSVVNWSEDFEKYEHGCLITGIRHPEGIEITDIQNYILSEEETRSSDVTFSCHIFKEPAKSSYVPFRSYYNYFSVNIYIHVIRSSYGVGLDKEVVQDNVVNQLNVFYGGTGIGFVCNGSDYIDDNAFNSLNYLNFGILSNIKSHSDAIDIYIQSNGEALGKSCVAYSVPSTSLISNSSNYNENRTIAHAIGHCLGLFHTYYGTREGYGTPELVNGSNSEYAGDYCIDTPADPGIWNHLVGLEDENNMQYMPDIENFMNNYHDREVAVKISHGQLSRINKLLQSDLNLTNVCSLTSPYKMSGPTWINLNEKFTVSFPEYYSVTWDVTCRTYLNKSESNFSTSSSQGHSWSIPDSLVSGNSKRLFLNAYGKSQRGFKFLLTKEAKYLNICPETSSIKYTIYNNSLETGNGMININDISQVVKIPRGGDIKFEFYDLCGVSNSDIDMTYWNNNFLKIPAARFTFNCLSTASLGYQKYPLNINYDGKTKMIPIAVEVVK